MHSRIDIQFACKRATDLSVTFVPAGCTYYRRTFSLRDRRERHKGARGPGDLLRALEVRADQEESARMCRVSQAKLRRIRAFFPSTASTVGMDFASIYMPAYIAYRGQLDDNNRRPVRMKKFLTQPI